VLDAVIQLDKNTTAMRAVSLRRRVSGLHVLQIIVDGGVRKAQREATATELRRSRQDAEPGFRRRDQGLAIAGPCGSFSYVELHWTTRLDGASSRLRW
jgi:hypothetical protein